MKTLAICSLAAALACGTAFAQPAKSEAPVKRPRSVCLWTYMIDHTKSPDPNTIIFYMRGGKAWKNTLQYPCRGLRFHGFAYVTRDGQICSNMQSIIVLESHDLCMLGDFTPYTPPPKGKKSEKPN